MTNTVRDLGPALAMNSEPGKPPQWVHLVPAGTFTGADGRGPYTADAAAIIAASPPPFVVDFVHQSDHALHSGQSAPAAGWVVELQARDDGVWGRVDWTPGGRAALGNKEYRFISPVFTHSTGDLVVRSLLRAGLTNTPNIRELPILNSVGAPGGADATPLTIAELLRRSRDAAIPNEAAIYAAMNTNPPPKEGT